MQQTVNNSADQAVLERILAFKTDVENPSKLKTNQTISVDDAVWLVEAALNYTYCKVHENIHKVDYMQIDSTDINFNYSTNIDYFKVIDVYNCFSQWFDETKTAYDSTTMYFSIADVYTVDNVMRVKTIIEFGHNQQIKSNLYYLISGDWMWGEFLGNCSGQFFGIRDATTEINSFLQSVLNPDNIHEQCFFTDVLTASINGGWISPNFEDLLWHNSCAVGHDYCMPEAEVRYWAEKSVIAQQNARIYLDPIYQPNKRTFQKVIFSSKTIRLNNVPDFKWCYHVLIEFYGKKHYHQDIITK